MDLGQFVYGRSRLRNLWDADGVKQKATGDHRKAKNNDVERICCHTVNLDLGALQMAELLNESILRDVSGYGS